MGRQLSRYLQKAKYKASLKQKNATKPRYSWMSDLPDSTNLFDILIPGTHDTATSFYTGINYVESVRTQTMNIKKQLRIGTRNFDLRPRDYGDGTYPMHHGDIFLDTHLDTILAPLEEFVKNNPSETLIVNIKPEDKPEIKPGTNIVEKLLEPRFTQEPYFTTWQHFKDAQDKFPELKLTTQNPKIEKDGIFPKLDYNVPLKVVRGRILIVFRDGIFASDGVKASADSEYSYYNPNTLFTGIDAMTPGGDDSWGENQSFRIVKSKFSNDLAIQDMYEGPWKNTVFGNKEGVMKAFWKKASDDKLNDKLWFNAANTARSVSGELFDARPAVKAGVLNPILTQAIDPRGDDNLGLHKELITLRGIVSLDFINQDLTNSIIEYNKHLIPPSDNDDFVRGTASDDVLESFGGDDVIYAGKGDDTLIGGEGGDRLHGGEGDDLLIDSGDRASQATSDQPSPEPDFLFGDSGDDIFEISRGDYIIDGGEGKDTLRLQGNLADYKLQWDYSTPNTIILTNSGGDNAPLYANLANIEYLELI